MSSTWSNSMIWIGSASFQTGITLKAADAGQSWSGPTSTYVELEKHKSREPNETSISEWVAGARAWAVVGYELHSWVKLWRLFTVKTRLFPLCNVFPRQLSAVAPRPSALPSAGSFFLANVSTFFWIFLCKIITGSCRHWLLVFMGL